MKKDISMLGKGKSDPYAIVTVGAQTFRTQTIDNTVNPKWDYWCEVSIAMLSTNVVFSVIFFTNKMNGICFVFFFLFVFRYYFLSFCFESGFSCKNSSRFICAIWILSHT